MSVSPPLAAFFLLLLAAVQGSVFPWPQSASELPAESTVTRAVIDPQCILNTTYPNFLPWTVLPRHYQLNISAANPNTNQMIYNGSVTINVDIIQTTSCIVLNSNLITYKDVNLKIGSSNLTPTVTFNQTLQFAILQFSSPLPLGSAVLNISFVGQVNTAGAGFFISDNSYSPSAPEYPQTDEARAEYISKYPKISKDKSSISSSQAGRKMYATQMEPTSARRAFPCFDEPDLKATWQAKITIPANQGLTALFNTRESRIYTTNVNGVELQHFEFERTLQVMSSYLVAMAIGELDYVEANAMGIRFRVYTPPGASKYGTFALNLTVGIVKHFSDIWSLSFAEMNTKMDQISVPNVVENAMENWGLLTYWPPFLLVDSNNSTRVAKELVSIVTVHEISHQWFGDTITCPSFQSEFLQEGFARLFQYTGTNYLFPDWHVFSAPAPGTAFGDISFYGWPYNTGMTADFKGVTPPIIVPLNETALSVMFYEKGASVNRMLYLYLGRDKWNQALAYHLQKHKWTNPNVYDLARSFDTTIPNFSYESTILPWLLQPNFPVVTLHVDNNNKLIVSQQPMSKYASPGKNLLWWIPLKLRGQAGVRTFEIEVYLSQTSHTFALPSLPFGQQRWLVQGNYNYTSFVVVNYADRDQWNHILEVTASPALFSVDRQEQVLAIFMLATMSHVDLSLPIELTAHHLARLVRTWVHENNVASAFDLMQLITSQWQPIISSIIPLSHLRDVPRELRDGLFVPLLAQLGWNANGNPNTDNLRNLVTYWAVYLDDHAALVQATRIFDSQGLQAPSDVRKAVFLGAAMSNAKTRYATLQQAYTNNQTSSSDRALIEFALTAGPTDIELCKQTLSSITQVYNDYSPRLSAARTVMTFSASETCRARAWAYYESTAIQYWQKSGASATTEILSGIDAAFATREGYNSVQSFLTQNQNLGSITQAQIKKVLTLIQINIDLVAHNSMGNH